MQHGMLWVQPILPEQHEGVPGAGGRQPVGLVVGADGAVAPRRFSADAFSPGDEKTARMFGHHFAQTLLRLGSVQPVAGGGVMAACRQAAPLLFGFILSGLMSLLVAGISTFRNLGWTPDFLSLWARSG